MARNFTSTTDRITDTSFNFNSATGSIFLRIKPNWDYNDGISHMLFAIGDYTYPFVQVELQKAVNDFLYVGFSHGDAGDSRIFFPADASMFSNNVWANHIFTWDDTANEQIYYVNNVQKGYSSSAFTGGNLEAHCIGNFASAFDINANSSISDFGVWNRVLTQQERGILQITGCPLFAINGLVSYMPLNSNVEYDKITGRTFTISGTSRVSHPTTILPE